MAVALKATENVTVEQIEAEEARLAVLKANLELSKLQTNGLAEFKKSASEATSIEDAYKVSSNFKWKVEKIRRVLNPPKEGESNRGRPKGTGQQAKPQQNKHR